MRRPAGGVALVAAFLSLTACTAASTPTPAPSAVPLRTVAACAASVAVPAESVAVAPSADSPPTTVVQVGDSVTFPVPSGARVGIVGDPDPSGDAQLCAAAGSTPGTATWVAQSLGYLRVATQVGKDSPARFFLRVTS